MKEKILIVDDEIDLLDILAYNLEKNGYRVDAVSSGEQALEALDKENEDDYSLILLDVMMQGINGFQTAEKIRAKDCATPIIFLTALDTESDILQGFSLGADDYIAKPFSVKEVVARVKAVLSRIPKKSQKINVGNIVIDLDNKSVSVDGETIKLTKTEFMLLVTLAQNTGKIFSRENLLSKVWREYIYVEARTVDVHIARLRKKLLTAGTMIVNRSGYGYCIET